MNIPKSPVRFAPLALADSFLFLPTNGVNLAAEPA